MRTILLNPGPVTLSERVRRALLREDLCHREPEFATLQDGLRNKLLAVYGLEPKRWAAVLLTGSGTAAVEAMLTSCVPRDGQLLIAENGVYGERMSRIAAAHGVTSERVSAAWDAPIDVRGVTAALARNPAITHVAAVHHETTTGRLNALDALAEACTRYGARLLLDGVSSFGAEDLAFGEWPLDACAATANKCLHGVPGTAFVMVRRAALAGVPAGRSVYLDLAGYLARQDEHGTPFTQSVQTFYALDEALDEFFEAGGQSARGELYRGRLGAVRERLLELGVRPLLDESECSCVLHAFELPEGRTYAALHDALKARGFVIYAGQGALSERVFRISAMGDIRDEDMARLLAALGETLGA